jgi:putative Mn2+ efflux pump MntP
MLRVLTIASFITPLAVDTFALGIALGAAGITTRERTRASLILTGFEAGMPVVGLLAGATLAKAIGDLSNYAAGAVLAGTAIFMLWQHWRGEDEEKHVALLGRIHGTAVIGLGLSVSMDELAIGFGAGLLGLPVVLLIGLIAVQAFVAAQVGIRLGSTVSHEAPDRAELTAAVLLLAAAGWIVAGTVFGVSW